MRLVKSLLARKGRRPLVTLEGKEPVSVAIKAFSEGQFRCIPITTDGALSGVITSRDILRFLSDQGADGMKAPISEAMTKSPTFVSATDAVSTVEELFDGHFNHLPVVEDGKPIGILTPADVLGERLHEVNALASDLERYITRG